MDGGSPTHGSSRKPVSARTDAIDPAALPWPRVETLWTSVSRVIHRSVGPWGLGHRRRDPGYGNSPRIQSRIRPNDPDAGADS